MIRGLVMHGKRHYSSIPPAFQVLLVVDIMKVYLLRCQRGEMLSKMAGCDSTKLLPSFLMQGMRRPCKPTWTGRLGSSLAQGSLLAACFLNHRCLL